MSFRCSCAAVSAISTRSIRSPRWTNITASRLPGERDVQVQQGFPGPIMRSPYKFKKYGQSGIEVSELFPHVGSMVDDIALIRSAVGRSNDHSISHFEWNTGAVLPGSPSYGAWVTYGLGTENQNLPAFVVLFDHRGGPYNGPNNWGNGYLPAAYQGTAFRSVGDPILDLRPPAEYVSPEEQRARLDFLARLNQEHEERFPGVSELSARIASYELAYRMQSCAPETVDLSKETEETKNLYGLDQEVTRPFGRQCLLARRLVERGVRFVQLWSGAYVNDTVDTWDAHNSIVDNHGQHAKEVDKPIAGLLQDLKRRGMLDDTLSDLAHRVRANADFAARRRPRPQSERLQHVDGGRGHSRRPGHRRKRRFRLPCGEAARQRFRFPRQHPAQGGTGSQAADLLFQWPQHAPDRCARRVDSPDRGHITVLW